MTEDNFKQILQEKEPLVGLSENFDNELMAKIRKHAISKTKDKKYLRLMYLFFFIGLLFGITIAMTFVDINLLFGTFQISLSKLVFLIPLIGIILFFFEKIYKATLVKNGREEFSSM